jgi:hypothetical protein
MTRYTLARQAIRLYAMTAAVLIVLAWGVLTSGPLVQRIEAAAGAIIAGLLVSLIVPDRMIRWGLDRRPIAGAFVMTMHVMFGLILVIAFGMAVPGASWEKIPTVLAGTAYILVMSSPATLGLTLLGWYPMIAVLLYIRERRDFV